MKNNSFIFSLGACRKKNEECKTPYEDPDAKKRCCEDLFCNPRTLECNEYAPSYVLVYVIFDMLVLDYSNIYFKETLVVLIFLAFFIYLSDIKIKN